MYWAEIADRIYKLLMGRNASPAACVIQKVRLEDPSGASGSVICGSAEATCTERGGANECYYLI